MSLVYKLFFEFHLLLQEVALQEVRDMGVCTGRTQDTQIQQCLVQVLLRKNGSFHSILGFTPLILRRLPCIVEEGTAAALAWHFEETLGAVTLLLGQLAKEVAHTIQSHIVAGEIEAQREPCG